MKIPTLFLASLIASAIIIGSSYACEYEAINNAIGTPGGTRFQNEIGLEYSIHVLKKAASYFWKFFGEEPEQFRKNVTLIALTIQSMPGIVTNINGRIFVSADYIGNYLGDVRTEFTGILYHEVARVWQWDAHGKAPIGLLTGIADFFRLKAGYAPARWVRRGEGFRWDEGYDVTARFLDYCNERHTGFVSYLNAMMQNGYDSFFFVQFTGNTVDELWNEYKAQFGG